MAQRRDNVINHFLDQDAVVLFAGDSRAVKLLLRDRLMDVRCDEFVFGIPLLLYILLF